MKSTPLILNQDAVVQVNTALSPLDLLDCTQAIEQQQGRVRKDERWGPRSLDLDNPKPVILFAMQFLGFALPDDFQSANIEHILAWGCQHWHINQLPNSLSAPCPF